MDKSYLKELGPYLKALSCITYGSEKYKNREDKLTPGKSIGGVRYNIGGSFLLFRGTPMKEEWIRPYEKFVGSH